MSSELRQLFFLIFIVAETVCRRNLFSLNGVKMEERKNNRGKKRRRKKSKGERERDRQREF